MYSTIAGDRFLSCYLHLFGERNSCKIIKIGVKSWSKIPLFENIHPEKFSF